MSYLRKAMQSILRIFVFPIVVFLFLIKRWLVIELVLPNVTLFGHLALEPEKILSKRNESDSARLDTSNSQSPKKVLVWSFAKPQSQVNKSLVRLWRRELFALPSAIVTAMHQTSKWLPNFEIKILQFDKLHENDHVLDSCGSHLRFSAEELRIGADYLKRVGIKPGVPYVCLIVRESAWAPATTGPLSSGTLRSRSFEDFIPAAEALLSMGLQVIKLGAPGTFAPTGTRIIDYANSSDKSEFLDVYLPSRALCAVSTMSGPDAVSLVSRVPVLYIDIAQYSLCFAGTKLVTWVPALLSSEKLGRVLSLTEVFESGAGRFLGADVFVEAGISILNSSPHEIKEHAVSFCKTILGKPSPEYVEFQRKYQTKFRELLSLNSASTLGPFESNLSETFLQKHGEKFLS